MTHSYLRLLADDDSLLRERGVQQDRDAIAAWHAHITPRSGSGICVDRRISELMVLCKTMEHSYSSQTEFTLDYGGAYR